MNAGELSQQEIAELAKIPENIPQIKLDKLARHRTETFADSQKTPAQRVKHRLTTVPAKYSPFPKMRYHPHQAAIVVKNADDEAERAPSEQGWVDHPSQYPPSPVREFGPAEKLAMLDEIANILGVEAGESPVDKLIEFRDRYNQMAAKLAHDASAPAPAAAEPEDKSKKKGK
jgi:hypothetical protein